MKKLLSALVLAAGLSTSALPAFAGGATQVPNALWADGTIYNTVLTPSTLPDSGKFDQLYNFDASGLRGQRSISETKPGDADYNGGRWEVRLVTFTEAGRRIHDPDGDGMVNFELTSDAQLRHHEMLGHLVISSGVAARFVCPVIPAR